MLNKFLLEVRKLYINDRHEEADTDKEDKKKLCDKRILPLLEEEDYAVFGSQIDDFLWNYYRKLGLAKIKENNIFYVPEYLNYISLTEAVLNNELLLKKIKQKNIDLIIPYIESYNSDFLAKEINAKILREALFVDWINNKSNYRQVIKELNFPLIPGFTVNNFIEAKKAFKSLKKQGFRKVVLRKERSVAGFGVFIINTEKKFEKIFNDNFLDQESFLLEGFIEDIKHTSNVQYWIGSNEIIPIVISDQILDKDKVSYNGSIFPSYLNKEKYLLDKIKELSLGLCDYLQSKKCYGFVGIDYIITNDRKIYSTEVNARFNASTFNALLVEKLLGSSDNIFWKSFNINNCFLSFQDLFNKLSDYFIVKKGMFGIFPMNIDLLKDLGEGQFMIIGKSFDYINNLEKEVKKII